MATKKKTPAKSPKASKPAKAPKVVKAPKGPRTVLIIQARMGSTRLPGKVLKEIGGKTMLERTVERAKRATLVTEVAVATSTLPQDDAIEELCKTLKVACVRGSESDVLDRYLKAAKKLRADVIVRVTSDCPLIDPEIIDKLVSTFEKKKSDYGSNFLTRHYPRGLDAEIFTTAALEKAGKEAKKNYEREHVTPYLFEHPKLFKHVSVTCAENLSMNRWTVDTEKDLRFVRTVYDKLGKEGDFGWKEILELLKKEPAIAAINRSIQQKYYGDKK